MADILIRGINTPKEPTPLTLYPDGRWNDFTDGATGEFLSLPDEYGRLGDLDALEKELAFDYAYAAAKVCHNAPTIIPATAGNVTAIREELFAAVQLIIKNCKEQIIHDCNECALYDYCFDGMPFFGRAPCDWPDPEEGSGKMENNICFTCKHASEYPECPAANDDIVFASNGDTIIHCKAYKETERGTDNGN